MDVLMSTMQHEVAFLSTSCCRSWAIVLHLGPHDVGQSAFARVMWRSLADFNLLKEEPLYVIPCYDHH